MSPAQISFLLTGSATQNSRAIRQLQALRSAGFKCAVWDLGTAPEGRAAATRGGSLTLRRSRGPAFFLDAHLAFSRALRQSERSFHPHVIHASDLYALPAARKAARRVDAALTFDARELYPHVAATVGRPWVSRFWGLVESRLIPQCDAVFTVNGSIADRIAAHYGVPRPVVVENVPPTRDVPRTNLIREALGLEENAPVVLHQGHIRHDRGCGVLVRAAADVPEAHVVFLGDGPAKGDLLELAAELRIQNRIHFMEPVLPDRLLSYTASATIGVTLLEDTCLNHRLALPNKLFEYLMAGVPVLATDLPEIGKVITDHEVGRLVTPGDVHDTAKALHEMISQPESLSKWRANTRRVFETINWETASERFVNTFQRLAHP